MNEMSPEQAFQILDLHPDAGEEELKKAFRDKSQTNHPDKPNGDETTQKLINEARSVAESVIVGHASLVALRSGNAILRFEKALAAERAARQAHETETVYKRNHTRLLHRIKYATLLMGVVNGALGWFGDKLLPELANRADLGGVATLELLFKLLTGACVAAAGIMQFLVHRVEADIEAWADELRDPRACAAKLAAAFDYRDESLIDETSIILDTRRKSADQHDTPDALHERVTASSFGFFSTFASAEHVRLLLLKSIEHGLITRIAPGSLQPDTVLNYQVHFLPSTFRPKPPVPPTSPTVAEARSTLIAGLLLSAIAGSLTLYLGFAKHSWWAIVPAFFILPAIALITSGFSDIHKAKQGW